jgi:hypothetical protein
MCITMLPDGRMELLRPTVVQEEEDHVILGEELADRGELRSTPRSSASQRFAPLSFANCRAELASRRSTRFRLAPQRLVSCP